MVHSQTASWQPVFWSRKSSFVVIIAFKFTWLARNQEQLQSLFSWQKGSLIQCSPSPSSQLFPPPPSHLWTHPLPAAMDIFPRRVEGWAGASARCAVDLISERDKRRVQELARGNSLLQQGKERGEDPAGRWGRLWKVLDTEDEQERVGVSEWKDFVLVQYPETPPILSVLLRT